MPVNSSPSAYTTRASLLLRLNSAESGPREIAWEQFHDRYAPVIAGFARNLGGQPQEIDDVIQDVLVGFYAHSPAFVYDPSKGRFRGYLKVCTLRALQSRMRKRPRLKAVPLDRLQECDVEIEQVWNDVWAQEQLNRALTEVRDRYAGKKTFDAFHQHVLKARPADHVARELGMTIDGVRKAKQRITRALARRLKLMQIEEG